MKTGRVIGRGDSKNQLYHLDLAKTSNPFDSICLSSTAEKIDSITWHARLGHPHARAIELIIPNMSFDRSKLSESRETIATHIKLAS